MLALIKNNPVLNRLEVIGQYPEGGWADLPDGSRVSPAQDGWELRGYELKTIVAADAIPDGHHAVSVGVEIVSGAPKYVYELAADQPTIEAYSAAVQQLLDATAGERRYDSIQTAVTYRDDPNPQFASEAAALFAWRSAVWTYAYAELAKVEAGQRAVPTIAEFLTELPSIDWP